MIHLRVTRDGRVKTRTSWNLMGKRTNRFGFSFSIGSSSSFSGSLVSVTGGSSGRPTRGTALSSELLETAGAAVKSIFLTGDSILRFSRALAAYNGALSVYNCNGTCRGEDLLTCFEGVLSTGAVAASIEYVCDRRSYGVACEG